MRRVALAALAAFLVLTPASVAKVIPDACIAGIGLWDNSTTVLRRWGRPLSKLQDPPDVWWDYKRGNSVLLTSWHGSRKPKNMIVVVIRTQDPNERLPSGIGLRNTRRYRPGSLPALFAEPADLRHRQDDRPEDDRLVQQSSRLSHLCVARVEFR